MLKIVKYITLRLAHVNLSDVVELFRRQISDDICWSAFYFNKISFGKTFICKVERLNAKQIEPSHLDLYCLQKLLLSPVAVKELIKGSFLNKLDIMINGCMHYRIVQQTKHGNITHTLERLIENR